MSDQKHDTELEVPITKPDDDGVCGGTISAVNGDVVTVMLEAVSACAACRSKDSCNLISEGSQSLEVAATGFKVGDRVRVHSEVQYARCIAAGLYLMPTLLIILGAFTGYFTVPLFLQVVPDLGSLIGVVVGILLSFVYIHFFRAQQGPGPLIRLEKIEAEYDG